MTVETPTAKLRAPRAASNPSWVWDVLLVLALLAAAYFRFTGLDWGDYRFLHPDERFLIWVTADIRPTGLDTYFNTELSTMNPHNVGHGFFVYGTFPIFATRFLTEWFNPVAGWNEISDTGRALSGTMDLLTVFWVAMIATRLFDRRVGALAAAFSAVTVLQIQQSHFFTTDTFSTSFSTLALYIAVWIATEKTQAAQQEGIPYRRNGFWGERPTLWASAAFGAAVGLAMASKINTAPIAVLLAAALIVQWLHAPREESDLLARYLVRNLFIGGLTALLVFRVLQPYAFSGPGFFGLIPNEKWIANLQELARQTTGDVDFPPALQWARRPVWFALQNQVLWGLGLPLGVLAWAGFLWMGWQMLRGEGRRYLILWGWTALYFIWQSLQGNPTMRYLLPVYPTLAVTAAWAVFLLWDRGRHTQKTTKKRVMRIAAAGLGLAVLGASTLYAVGFLRVYTQPTTRVAASDWIYANVPGPINLELETAQGRQRQLLSYAYSTVTSEQMPYFINFTADTDGTLNEILVYRAVQAYPEIKDAITVTLTLREGGDVSQTPLGEARLTDTFQPTGDVRGRSYTFTFDQPIQLRKNVGYSLQISVQGAGGIIFSGGALANESSWDDGLPLRTEKYDGYGGIYQPDLNFEMYFDDNLDKLNRFQTTLDQADYVLISSNRQWGTTVRVPERYPLTALYYRNLLGCPADQDIIYCYRVAQPGMYTGNLGFELVQVFQTDPGIGRWSINDQFAEEAFTVYDHPKVLIFKKTAAYDSEKVRALLATVDLSQVVHLTPKQAGRYPGNLMLPANRLAEQQAGGTWSELFDTEALINQKPGLALVLWYLVVSLLGWAVYPTVRLALGGLKDRGLPFSRLAGVLLLAYFVWLVGSAGVAFNRTTITLVALALLIVNAGLALWKRREIAAELRENWKQVLAVELVSLGFFALMVLVRLGNPDLWHPWKGGEKPMDFSYLNAVLKSTTFPPYDPWYAGGYINYYYYGFVVVGVLVKWLGIVPSVAYNLILPTLYSLTALGAFSLGWNLVRGAYDHGLTQTDRSITGGLATAAGLLLLGNWGSVRMIWQGFQRLAAPGGVIDNLGYLQGWNYAIEGFARFLSGDRLPYAPGDWLWIPSRAIPGESITEFPAFTFLYADLHAHMIALPITVLTLGWGLSVLLGKWQWGDSRAERWIRIGLTLFVGGLAVGALRPTNTWDLPVYLVLGVLALAYSGLRYGRLADDRWPVLKGEWRRYIPAAGALLVFVAATFLLYRPFSVWYGQGYTQVQAFDGGNLTPMGSYLTHWGLFLFVIVSWLTWETIDWMAATPLSALARLKPFRWLIVTALLLVLTAILALWMKGVSIGWLVVILGVWVMILITRPQQDDLKRAVLFMTGSALFLTLMVELIALVGDIGRMNTVFKFYYQAWTLFAVSSAAALMWLMPVVEERWKGNWRSAWMTVLSVLIAGAALFPLLGGSDKIRDRMSVSAPHTLDGMTFMQTSTYWSDNVELKLSEDYSAIRWMQENVKGSPVIVEANTVEYQWGSRYSVYTGLPGVVGYNWHQRQQRGAVVPGDWVTNRVAEVAMFYSTENLDEARAFLKKYNVRYIVVGQLERAHYPGPGMDKFEQGNGRYWRDVYRDGETVIYQVLD